MVAEALFPTVSVSRLKGKIPVFGKEAFIVRDLYRAIRAQSNRIPPADLDMVDFETRERDVEIAADYLEEEESAGFYRLEQRITKEIMDILLLNREMEAADYAQKETNYDPALRIAIPPADAWNNPSGASEPLSVIADAVSAVRSRIARDPNTMVIGPASYKSLVNHISLLEKIKYSGVHKINRNIISELTEIPNIVVGKPVFSVDGHTFTDVWRDNIIIAYVDRNETQSRSEYNPSFGYTFRREGNPEIDTYYENGGKIKVIRGTDNFCIKVTGPDAAFLIAHTNMP